MVETLRCETCGTSLPRVGALASGCPRCLLSLASGPEGRDSNTFASPIGRPGTKDSKADLRFGVTIGRYRVLRKIGEGGMGAVYEAQQEQPHRAVALKLIRPELTSLGPLRRFEQESLALGRLQHPGIAQIYEAGTADTGYGPQPYFAMELIQGETLGNYAEKHRLTTRGRLELIAKVCDAVHHAHQRGLIHRDLKPSNILIDASGQPKVLDFGVARLTDIDTHATLQTGAGQLVGTLAYMSPEQALADPLALDIRTDVYSLGVILYELLAARLPYSIGTTMQEALRAIGEQEAARLGLVDRSYRGDVETIVSTALEKDKARRYSSAAELAADIRRYLRDEAILARAPSAGYQLQKFARRHRALVWSVAAVFVVLAAGVITSLWEAAKAGAAQRLALEQRDRARQAEAQADQERDRALQAGLDAKNERNRAVAAESRALRGRDRITWNSLARESVRLSSSGDDDELAALLAREAWLIHRRTPDQPRYLVEEALQEAAHMGPWGRRVSGHDGAVTAVSFSPDGRSIASGSADRTVRVWNSIDLDTPPVLFTGHTAAINTVAFSPDGTHIASGGSDRTIRIWNLLQPGSPPLSPVGYEPNNVFSAAFSRDGLRLVFGDSAGLWLWDLRHPGAPLVKLTGLRLSLAVAFSPDGVHVAGGDLNGVVRLWDLRVPDDPPLLFQGHEARVNAVAFSPDGKHLASAGATKSEPFGQTGRDDLEFQWSVRVWDVADPSHSSLLLPGQVSPGNSLAFSPDGKRLASAGQDGAVRLWNFDRPSQPPAVLEGHDGAARSVVFSRDGSTLVSGGDDYRIHIWNLDESTLPSRPFKAHEGSVESLAFSPDSAYLVSGGTDRTARLWDLGDRSRPPRSLQQDNIVRSLAFSPDGSRLASATSGTAQVWNMHNLDSPPVLLQDRNGIQNRTVVFSPDGAALASLTINNPLTLAILNKDGATPPFVLSRPGVKRWTLRNAVPETIFEDDRISVIAAMSETWGHLASIQNGNSILVWDLRRPHLSPLRFEGHKGFVTGFAFSRDETLLASSGQDLAIRVWNLQSPQNAPLTFKGSGWFVAFTLDDTRLVAGGIGPSDVRVWDLREPKAPPVVFKGSNAAIRAVAISRDGNHLAFGDADGSVWLWNLWAAAADDLCTRVSRNLSIEEWHFYVGESIPYERTCPTLPPGRGIPSQPSSSNELLGK